MSINLIDVVKQQLTNGVLDKVASLLGEDKQALSVGLDAALPAVLGGMANKATDINGAQTLLTSLTSGNHDGSIFSSLGSLLGGGSATQGLMSNGSSMVSSLFGNNMGGIVNFLASHAGIKSSSATSLMSMAAPLLMGSVGKQLGSNTSVATLMSLLGSQLPHIQAALPAGMSKVLGLSNINLESPVTNAVNRVTTTATNAVKAVEQEAAGFSLNSILPWLLLGLAALLGIYLYRTCNVPEVPKVDITTPVIPKMDTAMHAPVVMKKMLKIPGQPDMEVIQGSFLDKLYDEMTSPTLNPNKAIAFDNLNFATGKADIAETSQSQLNDLAKIMLAFPKSQINVCGHTDNVGSEAANLKLSKERASAVEKYLISKGIPDERITPIGYGSSKPVGDNATDAGRAANRRTEAFVVKK